MNMSLGTKLRNMEWNDNSNCNCIIIACCKKTVCVSIHTDRSTAVEFPHRQFHDRYTASAEYPQWLSHRVSWWTTACWGEYSREPPHQHTAAHPTGDHWEKMFVNDQQHCSQSHSSSLCQRKEEPEQYDQNCRDMSKYNMNFLKTLQLHKSRCIPSLQ